MTRRGLLVLAFAAAALGGSTLALSQGLPTRVEQGGKWFMDNGCYGCHTVGKLGTPIGPDLSYVGAKHSREYLERWLRDPLFQRPSAHMPRLELDDEQVKAVAAYLSSLR